MSEADGILCPQHSFGNGVIRGRFQVQRFLPAPWLNVFLSAMVEEMNLMGFRYR